MKHTPTPWTYTEEGTSSAASYVIYAIEDEQETRICEGCHLAWSKPNGIDINTDEQAEAEANAKFIVKAVNCHDELIGLFDDYPTYNMEPTEDYVAKLGAWAMNNSKRIEQALSRAKEV